MEGVTEVQRRAIIEEQSYRLEALDKHLAEKKFFAGDYLTLADISFYETVQNLKVIHKTSLDKFKNIEKH